MAMIGNHIRMSVPRTEKDRVRRFYRDILGCRMRDTPIPGVDLFVFDGETFVGIYYVDAADALSGRDCFKGAWLEIKTPNPERLKAELEAFGVTKVDFPDPGRFYFQAPGGQVFRLSRMGGGG